MHAEQNARDARPMEETPAVSSPEEGRPGGDRQAPHATVPLVLPCPLVVVGATQERETGRPLGDLLRRIAYL